ncbi:MAG TPA: DUF2075 domain-containing protein [Sedimenticola sp.]|nr:DUF2075 domain-containing protein [Sedimenticola sp.]
MYEDFYGLTGKPFQLSPDSRFFFNSKGHNRAMAYLRYGLEQGEGFIVITGGIGTGKTMLVRNLFDELDSTRVVAAELVTTQVQPNDMLRIVCASFGLTHKSASKATLLNNLEEFLRSRYREGKRVLLVVDEAQNLPERSIEELRMLANFQIDGTALLQCFLLGQDELKHTLQSPGMEQFRQRVIASYHLRALNLEEMQHYIMHRLRLVGWREDPKIADGVFGSIYEFTGGVPRRVNTLCDRMLLFGCLEEMHEIDQDALEKVSDEMKEEGWSETASQAERPIRLRGKKRRFARTEDSDLMQRLAILEAEIDALKAGLQAERRMVEAIQLRIDMSEDDDDEYE